LAPPSLPRRQRAAPVVGSTGVVLGRREALGGTGAALGEAVGRTWEAHGGAPGGTREVLGVAVGPTGEPPGRPEALGGMAAAHGVAVATTTVEAVGGMAARGSSLGVAWAGGDPAGGMHPTPTIARRRWWSRRSPQPTSSKSPRPRPRPTGTTARTRGRTTRTSRSVPAAGCKWCRRQTHLAPKRRESRGEPALQVHGGLRWPPLLLLHSSRRTAKQIEHA